MRTRHFLQKLLKGHYLQEGVKGKIPVEIEARLVHFFVLAGGAVL